MSLRCPSSSSASRSSNGDKGGSAAHPILVLYEEEALWLYTIDTKA